jgi:signal transduction histidine kinase/ActR/RegA family two-component response regulator
MAVGIRTFRPLERWRAEQALHDPSAVVLPFLAGGGEAGALVRAFDWSTTPVGPVHTWPASLKTTVGTILHSRHPMFLWWGPELIQFYNDAYVPSFGKGKHPDAMGQRGSACWQEIWSIIAPQIDDVMRNGTPSWHDDQLVPIARNGRIEDVYWTYGYSPVFDDEGGIGGTLVVCTETTRRVLAERRLQSMRTLAQATSLATDVATLITRAVEVLGRATRDVAFAMVYLRDTHADAPHLVRTAGLADDKADMIDVQFRTQLGRLATDLGAHPLPRPAVVTGPQWPEPVSHVCVVPIGPERHATGYLVVGLSPRLPFDTAYREYLRLTGEQIAQGQARIEAFHVRAMVENERNNLLEQAPMATALLTGPEHVFQLANPLYRRIVGRTDLIGRSYLNTFPELIGTPVPGILDRVYHTGEPFVTHEMRIPLDRTGHGMLEDCFFQFNLEPLRDRSGQVYGMMAVAVDITPQVVVRKALEQAQADHEQLLSDLHAASRAKDEFLAMLGHELRNPLAPIVTALQLMRLRGVREGERERAIIERQVQHVVRLVDDLLDVSRITRGVLVLRRDRVRLVHVVGKGIEQASPLIEQRRHRLTVDVPGDLYIDGDPARLAQVIANLLTNAAKYTEVGGHIDVQAARRDHEVWVRVRDTGRGIGVEMLPHVFDAFAQARQPSDRSQGGLGLGLAIVKSLVEAHGGSVVLQSEGEGRGTACLVTLPVAASDRDAPLTTPVAPQALETPVDGSQVLLVDDNEDAAEMLASALTTLGHRVTVATDVSSALEAASRYIPDVAVLDLGLPVIDGWELATRLRQQNGWRQVRFIALTGYGQQRDRERTAAAGFDAHLIKPINITDMDETLRHLTHGSISILP